MTERTISIACAAMLFMSVAGRSGAEDWSTFPYAMLGDNLVKVTEARNDQARVIRADGSDKQCRTRDIREIGDLALTADTAIAAIERAVKDLSTSSEALRQQLATEFDDGYLEMMAVILAMKDGVSASRGDLQSILLQSRERRLQALVDDCRAFDVDRFIAALKKCNFAVEFIEASALRAEGEASAIGREKTWIDAQAQVQAGEEQQSSRKRSSDLGRQMQLLAALAGRLREKTAAPTKLRNDIISLQNAYFQTYDKAMQFLKAYAAVRDRIVRGEPTESVQDLASSTASDWAREMLRRDTINATGKASSALALLDQRRNPPKPKPDTRPPEKKLEPPKKDDGCFVATAVYGSYSHPDVLVLRRFRDDLLAGCAPGRRFIGWYYRNGPIAAQWLNARPAFKPFVQAPLYAVVWGLRHPAVLLGGCVAVLALLHRRRKRRVNLESGKEVKYASAV